jgi:DNA-binding winged helix-turn-helix (wHTH) protein/Tol biopolymer transport system component
LWGGVMSVPAQFSRKVCFGEFELNLETAELKSNGSKTILPGQPFQVLATLLNRPGQLVTREELKRQLWTADIFVDFDHSLNKAVNRLREALKDSAEQPRFIETLPRKGYRFIGVVQGGAFQARIEGPHKVVTLPVRSPGHNVPIQNVPIHERPPDTVRIDGIGTATSGRRRKNLRASLIVLAIVAVTGLAILRWVWRPSRLDSANLQVVKVTDSGQAQGVAISADGKYVVYSFANGEAESLRLRQVATQSDIELLPSGPGFHGLTFSPDGTRIYLVRSDEKDPFFKYLYSIPVFGGQPRKLVSDVDSAVRFSPDGKHLVYEHCIQPKNDIELKIANVEGADDRVLATLHDASGFMFQPGLDWSPDGETIAVAAFLLGKQGLWVLYAVSVKDGSVRQLYTSRDKIGRAVWLPDSKTLIVPQFDRDARRTQLWSVSFPSGEARSMTHDLTDYGGDLDITRDGRIIADIAVVANFNVWSAPAANPTYGEEITHSGNPTEIAEAFDGKLLTLGADGLPWIMLSDGSQRRQFADLRDVEWPTPCGKFVVFQTNDSGMPGLVRVDRDGTHITKLAAGHLWAPACSVDGHFVFYVTTEQPQKIWRVSINGSNPEEFADVMGSQVTGRLAVSPDGTLMAYPFTRYGRVPSDGWEVAVIRTADGTLVRTLPFPGNGGDLHWSPNGRCLQYLLMVGEATNLWEQPLAGRRPKQLTKFTSGQSSTFMWSSDHQRLYFTRGDVTSDVVVLRNFQR